MLKTHKNIENIVQFFLFPKEKIECQRKNIEGKTDEHWKIQPLFNDLDVEIDENTLNIKKDVELQEIVSLGPPEDEESFFRPYTPPFFNLCP